MKVKRIVGCLWSVAALLLATSCFKTNKNVNPAHPSILQFIASNPSLTILNAAVGRVRLDTAMTSGGPYTFFAPSDSAFEAAGLTMDSINRMDAQQLLLLLKYHVVNGRVSAEALPGFLKQQFTSLHPRYEPFITKNYYGIFINGIAAIGTGNTAGDGIVQTISRVAVPPAGSQLQVMAERKDMTFFTALVRNVYVMNLLFGDPNPNSGYNGFSSYASTPTFGNTLLVPTDSAFRAFGYADTTAMIDDSTLLVYGGFVNNNFQEPLLNPYVLNGFVFTSDLKGQIPIEWGGSDISYRESNVSAYMISSLDGMSFTGNGIAPGSPVEILSPDIIASNGVIQEINQVFLSHD